MFTGGEAVPDERAAALRGRHRRARAPVLRLQRDRRAEPHHHATTTATTASAPRDGSSPRCTCACSTTTAATSPTPTRPATRSARGRPRASATSTTTSANDELFTDRRLDAHRRPVHEIDADGYLRVVGRTSDIIIRGGKNISAPAVEAEVARTSRRRGRGGGGDARRGLRRAGVRLRRARAAAPTLDLDDARHVPRATGASRPSGSRSGSSCVDALPGPPGGKVAKGELRADIRRRLGVEA